MESVCMVLPPPDFAALKTPLTLTARGSACAPSRVGLLRMVTSSLGWAVELSVQADPNPISTGCFRSSGSWRLTAPSLPLAQPPLYRTHLTPVRSQLGWVPPSVEEHPLAEQELASDTLDGHWARLVVRAHSFNLRREAAAEELGARGLQMQAVPSSPLPSFYTQTLHAERIHLVQCLKAPVF